MSGALRVLLVEDSEGDAKLIAHELQRGCGPVHWERVETAATMSAAVHSSHWDLILCDWSMPQFSGIAALELIRATTFDIPVIMVSGTTGEETAVEAMRAGARDYVLKGNLSRLVPAALREVRERHERDGHREMESALRSSEARFARLSQSGIIGIAVIDVLGNVHDANDAFLRWVGYGREELLAGEVRWSEMVPPELRHLVDRAGDQLRETGVALPWETEHIRKDGTRMPALNAVAMLDYPFCIAVVTDLSERRKAEAALRRTEEQLRQAQKMEAIGVLAGGVAHDFNNLLSVILSYGEMLILDLPEGDPMRADLDEIKHAGERATLLTKQLLAFSRHQVVNPQILDLNQIIGSLEKMLRRLLREDVELVTVAAPGLPGCRCDAGQIEQLIMNLAINGRDAMPEGGKLTVATADVQLDEAFARGHLGVRAGRHVMLTVADTGIGMDQATQARIFEPFFTTKEKGRGTGLGLSTVYGIVEQSGGTIWVESAPGRGTTFTVYLPASDQAGAAHSAGTDESHPRGSETILLVDDEDQIRKVAKGILQRHGYRVVEARNASEALQACEKDAGSIHLLVTDIVMPQMNGEQLADRLAAVCPAMKVLFMSGYTDGALVGRLAAGAAFLQKPVTPAALLRSVRQVLDAA